jgi:hypothetical protein
MPSRNGRPRVGWVCSLATPCSTPATFLWCTTRGLPTYLRSFTSSLMTNLQQCLTLHFPYQLTSTPNCSTPQNGPMKTTTRTLPTYMSMITLTYSPHSVLSQTSLLVHSPCCHPTSRKLVPTQRATLPPSLQRATLLQPQRATLPRSLQRATLRATLLRSFQRATVHTSLP